MSYRIKYQKNYNHVSDIMKESIDQLITKKVEGLKMSSYRKKYLKHPDAEALIKIDIDKNQDDTFDGSINISIT